MIHIPIHFVKFLILLLFAWMPTQAHAGFLSEKDYNDCIIENLRGIENGLAILEVKKACGRKYPQSIPNDDMDLIKHVAVYGGIMLDSHYRRFHNKHYSDMDYNVYLERMFDKIVKEKHPNMRYEDFLKKIRYENNKSEVNDADDK